MISKIGYLILLSFIIYFIPLAVNAQQHFINPLVKLAHTEYMKEHAELYQYTLKASDYFENYKYTFSVFFKDGSHKEIKSAIKYDTLGNKSYLSYEDKTYPKHDSIHRFIKLFPNQTFKIVHVDSAGVFSKESVSTGLATDSCWMFKIDSGYINAYSCLNRKSGTPNYYTAVIAIQEGSGPIVALNEKYLKDMVGQYFDAREAIQNKNYFYAIKIYNKQRKKDDKKKSPVPGT